MAWKRYPAAWLDELYARADIVQVVSPYVQLKRNGRNYWGLCPFHHEKTPSFSVSPDQNLYYCFGCKAGGNVVQFIMEMEHLTYQEAVARLAEQLRMPLPEMVDDPQYEQRRSQKERLLAANREAAAFMHRYLWTPEGRHILDYFYGRGLDDGIIRRFGLGASPRGWNQLTRELQQKGFTREELISAGLSAGQNETETRDFFRDRAMFPIIDQFGDVLAFGGRTLEKDRPPKYLNTGDTPVFNKRKGVFAANLLRKERNLARVLLVEGYMDVVALAQAGVRGAAATLGTSLTPEQARLLGRFAPEVWVAYDGDEPGQHAIEKALGIFEEAQVKARVLYFPDGLDPDEMIRQRGLSAFEALKPMAPARYRLMRLLTVSDLTSEEGRVAYVKAAAELLRSVPDPVEMEAYVREVCSRSGFDRETVMAQVGVTAARRRPETALRRPAPKSGEQRPARTDGREAVPPAESMAVALLAGGHMPKELLRPEYIRHPGLKSIAEKLLAGKSPSAVLEEAGPQERELAAQVFTQQPFQQEEDALTVAEDCLRRLRLTRLEEEFDAARRQAAAETDEERRRAAYARVIQLNAEINALKQPDHTKGAKTV